MYTIILLNMYVVSSLPKGEALENLLYEPANIFEDKRICMNFVGRHLVPLIVIYHNFSF